VNFFVAQDVFHLSKRFHSSECTEQLEEQIQMLDILKNIIDHFARCKQHWARNTSCFSL